MRRFAVSLAFAACLAAPSLADDCKPEKKVELGTVSVETQPGGQPGGPDFTLSYTVQWTWRSRGLKDGVCAAIQTPGMLIGVAEMRLKSAWDPKRIDSYRTKLKETFYLPKNVKIEQKAICDTGRASVDPDAQCRPASGDSPLVLLADLVAMNAPADQAAIPAQAFSVEYAVAIKARLAAQ
jgi:hypothetical protein